MWEQGCKMPTQMKEGRFRCFWGAELSIATRTTMLTSRTVESAHEVR